MQADVRSFLDAIVERGAAPTDLPPSIVALLLKVTSEREAAELVGIAPMTWTRMRARGQGPPVTRLSPRRIGYRLCDLLAWLEARREPAR